LNDNFVTWLGAQVGRLDRIARSIYLPANASAADGEEELAGQSVGNVEE
jgi:hypothetical protein